MEADIEGPPTASTLTFRAEDWGISLDGGYTASIVHHGATITQPPAPISKRILSARDHKLAMAGNIHPSEDGIQGAGPMEVMSTFGDGVMQSPMKVYNAGGIVPREATVLVQDKREDEPWRI